MSAKNETRKKEIFEYISSYIAKNGKSPTTDEICAEMSIGRATASKYVTRLIEEGLIEKNGRYGLYAPSSVRRVIRLPIIGNVACGKPKLAIEDIEGYLTVDEEYVGKGDFFALRASGYSMKNVGIDDGDIVYVRRQSTADDGDIVIALISDEITGERIATMKRFYRDKANSSFILHPENENMDDIRVKEIEIAGVAIRVLKSLIK